MDRSSLKSSVNMQHIAADKGEALWGMSAKMQQNCNARSCCGSSLKSSVNRQSIAADKGEALWGMSAKMQQNCNARSCCGMRQHDSGQSRVKNPNI